MRSCANDPAYEGFDGLYTEEAFVHGLVLNMLGQEVMRLVDETRKAERYMAKFDVSSLPSGIYIYSITDGNDLAEVI